MKARGLLVALGAVAVCAAIIFAVGIPEAYAAIASALVSPHLPSAGLLLATPVALPALRQQLADVQKRAKDKQGELKDGMTPEQIRTIDDDHAKLVKEGEALQRQISEAEAEQARSQPHAWSGDDIKRVTARAQAFGLDAVAANEVMADSNVRSIEQATDALQERAAKRTSPRQHPHVQVTRDEGDTIRAAVGDGVLLRANPQAITATDATGRGRIEAARNWRGMSLLEMGRAFYADVHGVNLRHLSRMDLAGTLLGMETLGRSAGMMSTSDFASILANVAAKRLRDAYAQAPQNWKRLGRQSNSSDFKTKSVVQLSSAPSFKLVREGQEFSYGGMTEGAESYALATYGRIIALTRQALINDDLGAFDRLPMMLGRQAAELCASTFWSTLTANANLSDGVALFHADHGNLANPGTAIDTTNLGKARAAMRKQKSLADKSADREPLNLTPTILVVGPDKEVEAQQALTAVLAAQGSNVNIFAGSLELITEARLTGNTWYLFADPALIDTIEYSFLEGEEELFIEQRVGFEVDGIEIKGRVDFAAKPIDFRGMYKNPGA